MTATTEHRHIRVTLTGKPHPGDDLLLPEGTPGVPEAVAEAERAMRESMPRVAEAGAALKAATAEAKAAPQLDRARDSAAAAAGRPLPKDRLADAATAALEAAQRRYDAESAVLADRQQVYGQQVLEHHADWSAAQDKIVSEAEAEALELLEQLGQAIDQLSAARAVRNALRTFPVHGGLLSTWRVYKLPALLAERQRVQAERELDRADGQGYGSARQVSRDTIALLVALRAEVRGRAPRAW